ncbi:hypothetical protein LguiA_017901 [Lonicera macranthoides]
MNIVGGSIKKKKNPLFSPLRSPLAVVVATPVKEGRITTTKSSSGGCCRGFNDCLTMGSTVKQNNKLTLINLQQQVGELEKEVEKQKEIKGMYRLKLERTQDYLRNCLQVAQDNGFLDIIINKKDNNINVNGNNETNNNQQEFLISPPPQQSPPLHHHSDLSALVDLANINGWYIHPHEVELHEKVAQGTTADIHRATWRGLDVAIKCIYPDYFNSNENGTTFFAQEVETLSRQRHRFVLGLMGACLDPPDHGWIMTEFLYTTVKDWLHGLGSRKRERVVPLPLLRKRVGVALEIAQGVQYLHEQKPMVLHRDLKLSNVFMDDAMHVRVADFGHARFLTDGEKALTGETGTYVYMAPEVIRCEPYDEKCDVYSFGILLNELITGEYPYIETDYGPSKIALEVGLGNIRPALPKHEEQLEELIELIQLSWDEDASLRPSFATITTTLKMIQKKIQ